MTLNRIEELKNQKANMVIWGKAFLLLYLFYASFFNRSFTSDHIAAMGKIIPHSLIDWSSGGRFLSFFLERISIALNMIHISIYENQFILQLILIALLSFAIYELWCLYNKYVCREEYGNCLIVILLISFVNPYFVEAFVYVAYEWGIGIVLAVLAVRLFLEKKYGLATCILFGAISIYQNFISLFLIYTISFLYLICGATWQKSFLKEYVRMLLVAGVAAGTNIALEKFVVLSGMSDAEIKSIPLGLGVAKRLGNICYAYFYTTYNCFGMLPKGSLFIIFVIIGGAIVLCLLRKRTCLRDVVYGIVVLVIINSCSVYIFGITENVWTAQRVVWPVFSALSVDLLILKSYFQSIRHNERVVLYEVVGLFALLNIYFVNTTIIDFYCSNKIDEQMVYSIQSEIEKYEEETGVSIKKIAPCKTEGTQYYYSNLNLKYAIVTYNHKAMYDSWSDVELINYITKSRYDEITMPAAIYDKYFSGKTWDSYTPSEQLVFKGDTLYWAIF